MLMFLVMGMELSWLYALLVILNQSVADQLSVPWLLAVFLISCGSSAVLRYLYWPKPLLAAFSWLLFIPVILLLAKFQLLPGAAWDDASWTAAIPLAVFQIFHTFEPGLLLLLSGIVLWLLGRRLAYIKISFPLILAEFQSGVIIFLVVLFAGHWLKLEQSGSIPAAIIFFILGLAGLSISHFKEKNNRLKISWDIRWSGLWISSILLILFCGILISLAVTPELLRLMIDALKWIWQMIEKIIAFIAGLFPSSGGSENLPPISTPVGGEMTEEQNGFSLPAWLRSAMSWGWYILFAGLILAAIWSLSTQIFGWLRSKPDPSGKEVESLNWSLKADIVKWLRRLLNNILRFISRPYHKQTSPAGPLPVAGVRELYRHFLRWAARSGYSMTPEQTPSEYGRVLSEAAPEMKEDLDFITSSYLDARYGGVSPADDELVRLQQAWDCLRKKSLKKESGSETSTARINLGEEKA